MSLKYSIIAGKLAFRPTEYAARVDIAFEADERALAERIKKLGCDLDDDQIVSVLERLSAASLAVFLEGGSVNLGGFLKLIPTVDDQATERPSVGMISGKQFDIRPIVSAALRKSFKSNVQLERQRCTEPEPVPIAYIDVATGIRNHHITPGGFGLLRGLGLKIGLDSSDEGVFLIPEQGDVIRVDAVRNNQPRELIFVNPPHLPAGNYLLESRVRAGRDPELRTGRLSATLIA